MTYGELYAYRHLTAEINDLEAELRHISFLRSAVITGGSDHGTSDGQPVERAVERCEQLENRILAKKREAMSVLNAIDTYISGISDVTVRTIFRKRFILGESYEQIGTALYMDRRTVARKVCAYLAEHE